MKAIDRYVLLINKPDTAHREIRNIVCDDGTAYRVIEFADGTSQQHFHFTQNELDYLYKDHVGKPYYDAHCDYMKSGHCVVQMLYMYSHLAPPYHTAIDHFRACVLGATDPLKAEPGTLRHAHGQALPRNGYHASDSLLSLKREALLFWSMSLLIEECPEFADG